MAQSSRISYTIPTSPPTTKTITLSKPKLYVGDPFIPREIQTALTGDTETILYPRLDIRVRAEFSPSTDLDLREQITNFWQWAQRGNQFTFAFDSTKVVNTTLTAGTEFVGDTALDVVNDTGVTNGQYYVIRTDNIYQLVKVTNHSAGDITIARSIDIEIPGSAVFRDQYFWTGIIRDPDQHSPIEDLFDPASFGTWQWALDFYEDVA